VTADVKPRGYATLSSDRWIALCKHFDVTDIKPGEIVVDEPVEIDGILYLPARYGLDERHTSGYGSMQR
jgi:hypothetical protein